MYKHSWFLCLTLAALLVSCSDDAPATDAGPDGPATEPDGQASYPNRPGGNPLVPEYAALPFPSDFYLVKDSTTATGFRVSIPKAALPTAIPSKLFADDDGFSRIPSILAMLPGGIHKSSLPAPDDGALTVSADSPAYLVKAGTWEKVPLLIELDMTAPDDTARALILRPLTLLEEKTQYVVLLRDKFKDLKGSRQEAGAAFAALRDGVKTADKDIEKQREDFKQVNGAIKALSLQPQEVVLGWTFRTRSEKQVVGTLVAMQQAVNAAPLGKYTIVSDKSEKSGTKTNRQIVVSMKVPNYVGATDGLVKLDASGKVIQQGERDVKFGMTIPSTVDQARPVVLYGHGFLGGWIQGTRGTWNDIATKHKFVTAATNMGLHEDLEKMVLAAIAVEPLKLKRVVSEVQQSLANVTYMARLVQHKLVTEITGKDSGGKAVTLIDKDKFYYHGISNGGTFGYVVAATSPAVQRASIIVGGGGLTHFLQRAVQWDEYEKYLKLLYQHPVDLQLMMSLIQMTLDPIDSMNYSPYLVTKRFTGLKPIPVALHMAVNDSQVRNLVTEWVARSAKIPLITPSPKKIYGLKTIVAPGPGGAPTGTLGAMFVYDEKVTPSPKTNLPPKVDNDTHGTVRKLSAYQTHVSTFLENGTFIQVCKGACDPE